MNTTTTSNVFLNEVLHGGICPLCFGLNTTKSRYGRDNPRWGALQVLEDKHHCKSCGNTWTTLYSENLSERDHRAPKVDRNYPSTFTWTQEMEEVTAALKELNLKLMDYDNFYKLNREGLLKSIEEIKAMPEEEQQEYLSGNKWYKASWNKVLLKFVPRDTFTYLSAESYDTSSWSGGRYGY